MTDTSSSTKAPVRRGSIVLLVLLPLLLASRAAPAQETYPPPVLAPSERPLDAPQFGGPGQWVILSTSTSASLSSETFSGSAANFFNAAVSIGVDRFVVRNLSIGINAEASYGDSKGYGAATLDETVSSHLAGGLRLGARSTHLSRVEALYTTLEPAIFHAMTRSLPRNDPDVPNDDQRPSLR